MGLQTWRSERADARPPSCESVPSHTTPRGRDVKGSWRLRGASNRPPAPSPPVARFPSHGNRATARPGGGQLPTRGHIGPIGTGPTRPRARPPADPAAIGSGGGRMAGSTDSTGSDRSLDRPYVSLHGNVATATLGPARYDPAARLRHAPALLAPQFTRGDPAAGPGPAGPVSDAAQVLMPPSSCRPNASEASNRRVSAFTRGHSSRSMPCRHRSARDVRFRCLVGKGSVAARGTARGAWCAAETERRTRHGARRPRVRHGPARR